MFHISLVRMQECPMERKGLLKYPPEERMELVGLTTAGDRKWEGMARWCGTVLRVQSFGAHQIGRSYMDLAHPYPIEITSDIARTNAKLTDDSYDTLVAMVAYTVKNNMNGTYRRKKGPTPNGTFKWEPKPSATEDLTKLTVGTLMDDPDSPGGSRYWTEAEVDALLLERYTNSYSQF